MTHGLNRQLVRRYLGPGLTLSASVPQPQVVALASALESRQLSAVRRYDILDTPPDGSFDRITALATSLFSVPIAIIIKKTLAGLRPACGQRNGPAVGSDGGGERPANFWWRMIP
jgi:hypothetical protein